MKHITMVLYRISINPKVNGNRNSKKPVILFITVCSAKNLLSRMNPNMIFTILITAITKIHIKDHFGTSIAGNILNKADDRKTTSATLY